MDILIHPWNESVEILKWILLINFYKMKKSTIILLASARKESDTLHIVDEIFSTNKTTCIDLLDKKIKKVAICGGSGSFLIKDAIAAKADIFISGDIKYHDFFLPEGKILVADAGHFETEQFTCGLIRDILINNFPNFAVHLSERSKNPIHYL